MYKIGEKVLYDDLVCEVASIILNTVVITHPDGWYLSDDDENLRAMIPERLHDMRFVSVHNRSKRLRPYIKPEVLFDF